MPSRCCATLLQAPKARLKSCASAPQDCTRQNATTQLKTCHVFRGQSPRPHAEGALNPIRPADERLAWKEAFILRLPGTRLAPSGYAMNDSQSPPATAATYECGCEACVRDGLHEPDCGVHASPPKECSCGRNEQSKGAG